MSIAIKHRHTGEVLHVVEADTLQEADLSGLDLRYAYLAGADLYRADLRRSDLRHADLTNANLVNAKVWTADFRGAVQDGAKWLNDLCLDRAVPGPEPGWIKYRKAAEQSRASEPKNQEPEPGG